MPQVGDAPDSLNSLLDTVYKKSLDQYKGDKGKASATAWSAAKNAGWYKKQDKWTKKSESESSWSQWHSFWKHVEYNDPWNIGSMESLGLVQVGKSDLVGYQARILMAVPGKSLNGRVYLPETLRQAARPYVGKPFILDHVIDDSNKVVGQITQTSYGVQEGYDSQPREGLWGMAIGMMTREMFDKLAGRGPIPPLIRGVSIGGQGDGQYNADGGVLIKNFTPAELSITAFPGIPEAQIAQIGMIQESAKTARLPKQYPRWEDPIQSMTNGETQTGKVNIREIGTGPGQTNTPVVGSSPRGPIRGSSDVAANDSAPRMNIGGDYQVPQQTYGRDGTQVNPYNTPSGSSPMLAVGANMYANLRGQSSTEGSATGASYGAKTSRDSSGWSPKTPSLGNTTTQTPGFGKQSPSGTGLKDQSEEEESQRVQRVVASLQNDLNKVLAGMRGEKVQTEAKVDVSKPEEEEEEEAKGEEEEEEEEHLLIRHLARMQDKKLTRELAYNLGDQRSPSQGPTGDASMSDYQRTRIPIPKPGVAQGTLGQNFWNPPNEGSGAAATGFDKGAMHVTSGRVAGAGGFVSDSNEFVAANPVRSGGEEEEEEEEERAIRNRIIKLRMNRLFPGIEATGQTMPKTSTSVTKNYPSLGNTTTKVPGFGKQSPSGTGLKDQPEEEERYILKRLEAIKTRREAGSFDKQEEEEEEERFLTNQLIKIRQADGMKPSLDQPDEKPQGEEEEVRGPSLRQAEEEAAPEAAKFQPGDGMNINGNVLYKVQQNPSEQYNQPSYMKGPDKTTEYNTAPDIVPIEGSAPSLALGVGQTLWHDLIRRSNQPSEQQLRQMMEGWNQMKQPKVQPLPKVKLNTTERAVPLVPRGNASLVPTLPGVPARGMMSGNATLNPANYQTQFKADTRAVQKWGMDKLQELDKRPYQSRPFDQYNSGHALYRQYLAEHAT